MPADALIGRALGQYRVLERLAQGGMAVVYRGYQPSLDRYVAIKVLPPQFTTQSDFLQRFRHEASAIGRLRHPNILTAYDFGEHEGIPYIVMELVSGRTLRERLGKPLDPRYVALITRQIAGALDEAHRHGIIHRDIKPSNILLSSDEWALLSDFGVAKLMEESEGLTRTGMGVGTPEYMSPEQGQGLAVSPRSDVYSLGVVVYEMLVGRVPFRADTPLAVMLQHISSDPPALLSLVPGLPAPLQDVVFRAMRKRPSDRYARAGDFASALTRAVEQAASQAAVVEAPVARPVGLALPGEAEAGGTDGATPAADEAGPVTFVTAWGGQGPGALARYPARIGAGPEGDVLVTDATHHRVQRFTADGTLVWQRGSFGRGLGQFDSPAGVACDAEGNIYVADRGNHRVQKFDRDGRFLRAWGKEGSEPGCFDRPEGVAIDSAGRLYVADSRNHRVQCFAADGALLGVIGAEGSGSGQFQLPLGLAVDPLDRLYVADCDNNRIQVFDSRGAFCASWAEPELFDLPEDVAISRDGNVFVVDTRHHRVLRFSLDGALMQTWGGRTEFEQPCAVAVDYSGDIYVAEKNKRGLTKRSAGGRLLAHWKSWAADEGALDEPCALAIAGERLYVAELGNRRVQCFDLDGRFQGVVPRPSGVTAWAPRALSGGDSMLLVAESEGPAVWRLQKARWERLPRQGDETRLVVPEGVCADQDGNVYALDWARDLAVKIDTRGRVRTRWGKHGKAEGQFDWLRGIACDGSREVVVADGGNDRLQRFNLEGQFVGRIGVRGGRPGQFRTPAAVAILPDRSILVADEGNHRVQWLTFDGAFLAEWGRHGDGPGEFDHPRAVTWDRRGHVYVADAANNRIQKFLLRDFKPR